MPTMEFAGEWELCFLPLAVLRKQMGMDLRLYKMYHLPQGFQKCKGEVALKHWEETEKDFLFFFLSRHRNTVLICETERGRPGDLERRPESRVSAPYLFLAARGFRLIFFDLSLFFFGGSGFACMCLP